MADSTYGAIDYAFVSQFETMIHTAAEENPDWFANCVDARPGVKGSRYYAERTRGVEAIPITGRHQPTGFTMINHSRRFAVPADWGLSEAIDKNDEVKAIINPQGAYLKHFRAAYMRQTAYTCTSAMLGSAAVEDNSRTVTSQAIPSGQQIANGGTGLTIAKLETAGYLLDNAGIPNADRHIAVSPKGIQKLLTDTQVTSADFSSLQALMHGTIPNGATFLGFTWHKVSDALGFGTTMALPILPKSGNIRSCVVWWKDAVRLYMAREFDTAIVNDPGIWNNLRIMVQFVQGAVRVEDEGVVQLDIDESV